MEVCVCVCVCVRVCVHVNYVWSLSNPEDINVSAIFPYHLNKLFANTTVRLFEQNYYVFPLGEP